MELELVAFDSFGIKSSCFLVRTKDVSILVDPGIAEETGSFPLPWARKLWLLAKYKRRIAQACKKADIIAITHYHYDHHQPIKSWHKGKLLLIKDPKKHINKSQTERAALFLDAVGAGPKEVRVADGQTFRFGATKIKFSRPVWHGIERTGLGYVVMVSIQDPEKKLLYTSDIDGPYLEQIANLIIKENPDILIIDGPPSYLLGYLMAYYNLARTVINVCKILEKTTTSLYLLDHHLVRDYRYPELFYEVYQKAKKLNKKVLTAAEYLGKEPAVLAGYKKYGPTKWKRWDKFTKQEIINVIRNAIKAKLIPKVWLEKAKRL